MMTLDKHKIKLSLWFLVGIHATIAIGSYTTFLFSPLLVFLYRESSTLEKETASESTSRLPAPYLRHPAAKGYERQPSNGKLNFSNFPSHLTWHDPWTDRPSKPNIPVSFGYAYNPSILELEDGTHIFAARMSWVYGGGCGTILEKESNIKAMYNCLKTYGGMFADQTLLGEYKPNMAQLDILSPASASDHLHLLDLATTENSSEFDVSHYNEGVSWFDTRLIYPYNHRYPSHGSPSRDGKKIIVTSQKAEILRNADWVELYDDSVLGLQISLIGTLDPEGLLNRKDESAVQRYMQEKTMTRWYYYDEKVEQAEFEKRRTGSKWTPMATDVARLKCSSRPSHLSALPFDKTKSDVHVRPVSAVRVHSKAQEDVYHRRLAALTGGDWFTIKDKNWVPFHYQERLLWSYTIEPHIVCENDIDVNYIDEVDCVICVRKHQSSSPKTFDKLQKRIKGTGFDKVDVHLNGAPAYYIEEIDSYLGILHVIKIKHSKDVLGLQTKERFYEHYFYKTEAQPPFRVTEIAASRVPLERSQCWSPWFETDDTVQVEFVMYMQYHPDRPGKEIVLSYGEADRTARVTTLSMKTVFETFHDSSLS